MIIEALRLAEHNKILYDMAVEHRKMIHGAFYNAIREITGKTPDVEEMQKHAGIETFDHMNYADYIWKKQPILRVFAPDFKRVDGKIIVNQQVLQIWRTNARHRRN